MGHTVEDERLQEDEMFRLVGGDELVHFAQVVRSGACPHTTLGEMEAFAGSLGITFAKYTQLVQDYNGCVFEMWLLDYARRLGRDADDVRAEIIEERRRTQDYICWLVDNNLC